MSGQRLVWCGGRVANVSTMHALVWWNLRQSSYKILLSFCHNSFHPQWDPSKVPSNKKQLSSANIVSIIFTLHLFGQLCCWRGFGQACPWSGGISQCNQCKDWTIGNWNSLSTKQDGFEDKEWWDPITIPHSTLLQLQVYYISHHCNILFWRYRHWEYSNF